MWPRFLQALAACTDILLPSACLLCGHLLPTGQDARSFCRDCSSAISSLSPAHCLLCAQPFMSSGANHLCGTCLKRPPSFSAVHSAGIYQGLLKEAVHKLKYRNQLTLARPLGQLLGKAIAAAGSDFVPDRILPVPLHPRRLKQRGYNQALELARPLVRQLGCPLDTTLLQRTRNTPRQQGLSATERRSNLRGAFALSSTAPALRILLVDDVMTTGETVRECCRTLLTGGAEEVQVAVVGRA